MQLTNQDHILVTGAAGFIGNHLCYRLCSEGYRVTGIDNINDYYSVQLKLDRLKRLEQFDNFSFIKLDLADQEGIRSVFRDHRFDYVINLAAQAGVRHSLEFPHTYADSNITGFLNILEGCRHYPVKHLLYASSSSVYGANTNIPFSVHDNVDHPISLYAASKKANELMAHTYASLYRVPSTGLRFFSVYGTWGRPDMALFIFTRSIIAGKPIQIYNNGNMRRDFTYVDDIVESLVRLLPRSAVPNPDWNGKRPDPATSFAPHRLFNIGNNSPVELMKFISTLEEALGKEAKKEYLPMQPGDVEVNYADTDDLVKEIDFKPSTPVNEGIGKFVEWYQEYYAI